MFYDVYNDINDCQYLALFGGRGSGKSTSVAKYLIDNFVNYGYTFCLVNDNVDTLSLRSTYFDNAINLFYSGRYEIELVGIRFFITDLKTKKKYLFGWNLGLSREQKYKSMVFPKCTTIVREEFCKIDMLDYNTNEIVHFLSLVSTVFRDSELENKCKCIFIGNNTTEVTNNNPYFNDLFRINWNRLDLKQGDNYTFKLAKNSPVFRIVFVQMAYSENEVHIMSRIPNNLNATCGLSLHDEKLCTKKQLNQCLDSSFVGCYKFKNRLFYVGYVVQFDKYCILEYNDCVNNKQFYKCMEKFKSYFDINRYSQLKRGLVYSNLSILELSKDTNLYSSGNCYYDFMMMINNLQNNTGTIV